MERILLEMVKSLSLEDNAIYADHEGKKLIFAINAKNPEENDHRMGEKIMEVVYGLRRSRNNHHPSEVPHLGEDPYLYVKHQANCIHN